MSRTSQVFLSLLFFTDPATTEIYTLSLHDALPIWKRMSNEDHFGRGGEGLQDVGNIFLLDVLQKFAGPDQVILPLGNERTRSEEHTSELQSQFHLVCRLLLEKKKIVKHQTKARSRT